MAVLALTMAATELEPSQVGSGREWQLLDGSYWHLHANDVEDPTTTDAIEQTRGACPAGMVEVAGQMKVLGDDEILDILQKATCIRWLNRGSPERCAVYDQERWRLLSKQISTRRMHFCMDRFEYPNRKGDFPIVAVTWPEAVALCERRNERLCSEEEWTFACEGEEARPYPYGYVRDDTACVIDRPHRDVDERALRDRRSSAAVVELDRLWQGEASGSRPRCRSPFGVYDLTGNVDEWTRSVRAEGEPSILKGGYWGPVRTRCLPSTRAQGDGYYYYQHGLRCCTDVPHE